MTLGISHFGGNINLFPGFLKTETSEVYTIFGYVGKHLSGGSNNHSHKMLNNYYVPDISQ